MEDSSMENVMHIQAPNPEPYSIKVEKGQKGGYAWEIGIKGNDRNWMIAQIKDIDALLKKEFLEGA
jgi:hypothetical protein